jgi:hypothetical protein
MKNESTWTQIMRKKNNKRKEAEHTKRSPASLVGHVDICAVIEQQLTDLGVFPLGGEV